MTGRKSSASPDSVGMTSRASTIGPGHPSFGCDQAWFLFSKKDRAGRMVKLILVEAKNAWAVQTMERVVSVDGMASPDCELMTVHRQCPSIGIRSDLVEEVEYSDFFSDHVDLSRVLTDSVTSHALQSSFTDADRLRLAPAPATPFRGPSDVSEDVMAALTDLGYKRPQAKRIVDGLGDSIRDMTLEDALTSALRNAQAA